MCGDDEVHLQEIMQCGDVRQSLLGKAAKKGGSKKKTKATRGNNKTDRCRGKRLVRFCRSRLFLAWRNQDELGELLLS